MYINKENTTINTNDKLNIEKYSIENENGYFFLDENIKNDKIKIEKILSCKIPKLIIKNGNLIDVIEDEENIKEKEKKKEKENKIKCNEVCFEKFKIETDFYIMLLENKIKSIGNKLNKLLEVE